MNDAGAYALAIVCEATADRLMASTLADRVLYQEVEWVEPENLDLHRRWRGYEPGSSHLEWHHVPELARPLGRRAHGSFQGEPGAPDALAARKALLLLAGAPEIPDAVVLVRDSDGEDERRRGLEQARSAHPWPFPVILAMAHPKRECWILAGFEPRDQEEENFLAELRSQLGFDPCSRAEELTAKSPGAKRNAKRVLGRLSGGAREREEACWSTCALATLEERGRATGLAGYLEEVRALLVPLFSSRNERS